MKTRALWLVPLVVFATAPALAAPSSSQVTAAQSLFNDGKTARNQGQWAEALDKFQRSQDLNPSVGALLNIGECYEKLDKPASAWGAFREAESLAARLKDPREAVARDLAAKLAPRLAHLTIVTPAIEGLSVTRDGTRVDPASLDTAIPIDQGSYTLGASAPGRRSWSRKVDIAPGATAKVEIPELEKLPAEAPPPPPATPPAEPATESSTQRTVGIGLEIGGGAILATGLVFGALTMSSWSSATRSCPDGHCATQAAEDASAPDADRASTFGAISTVAVIAGAAALAGGIVLHLTAPKTKVALGPTGVSVTF